MAFHPTPTPASGSTPFGVVASMAAAAAVALPPLRPRPLPVTAAAPFLFGDNVVERATLVLPAVPRAPARLATSGTLSA